ncbi:MAG: hypothetical protein QOK15_3117 [Nocardioidaceae bacterium]|jgi:hypothetical protein|nr:hypothetical protein [Nocardioidaceae bacterium]
MAGGYGGRGLPLHARTRPDAPGTPEPAGAPPCPAKHCWVRAPVDGGGSRPGLLLEWRKTPEGRWEGRVSYAAELRPGRWATVEEWLGAELLSTA